MYSAVFKIPHLYATIYTKPADVIRTEKTNDKEANIIPFTPSIFYANSVDTIYITITIIVISLYFAIIELKKGRSPQLINQSLCNMWEGEW